MTNPLKIARFMGDPTGYRFNVNDVVSGGPSGVWVYAQHGVTNRPVRVNLDHAYLIEEDNAPAAPVAESTAGASTVGG